MSTLQEQARALGDPTRHGVFRYLANASGPVDVAELTSHFGLNHNAIRQHLAKLVAADLVSERTAPVTGRGRPRLLYTVDPGAEGRWGVTGPYERLSLWLSEIIRTGDTPLEVGRRVGVELSTAAGGSGDPIAEMVNHMEREGFDPILHRKGDEIDVTLGTCPFASTALAHPDTVCELHLGMAQGLAESLGGLVVDELVRKDPRGAQCGLRCHTEPDREPSHA